MRHRLEDAKIAEINRLYNEGYTIKYIVHATQLGITTVVRHIKNKNRKTEHKWTNEENEKLMRLRKEKVSYEDIAVILGKTKAAVQARYTQIKTGRYKIKN